MHVATETPAAARENNWKPVEGAAVGNTHPATAAASVAAVVGGASAAVAAPEDCDRCSVGALGLRLLRRIPKLAERTILVPVLELRFRV